MEETIIPEAEIVAVEIEENKPKKKAKKSIKDRQIGRIKKYAPEIDLEEIGDLLEDQFENRKDLRMAIVEQDADPKVVFNNGVFSKKLIKYIMEFKEETIDDINDIIEETKEDISVAVDNILEDKKVELFETMLSKFEMLIEMMTTKIEDLDKVKEKYDDMIDDMENKMIDKTSLKKPVEAERSNFQELPTALMRMLRR